MLAEALEPAGVLYVEPGQILVSTEPHILRTVLGSCVSVCLYDPKLCQGGMNHFMLPNAPTPDVRSFRYGDRALDALLDRLVRLGSNPHKLLASVYGGAHVLFNMTDLMHLGRRNVDLAFDWLGERRIPIVATGVLGGAARRLEFELATGNCHEFELGQR